MLSSGFYLIGIGFVTLLVSAVICNSAGVVFTEQGSKNLLSNTRQGGSKRKVLVAKVAV